MAGTGKTVWKMVKWALVGLASLILLLIAVLLFISTPIGQDFVTKQGEKYLRNKFHTNLSIGSFRFGLKKGIQIRNIYLEDQEKRLLLSVHQLDLAYDLQALFSKQISLSEIRIRGVQANIYRGPDSEKFNFDFISAAFHLDQPATVDDTTASAFRINFGKLNLDSIYFQMDDQWAGQKYTANINELRTDLRKTDLDKMIFRADYIFSDGLNIRAYTDPVKHEKQLAAADTSVTELQFISDTLRLSRASFRMDNRSGDPLTVITELSELQAKGIDYRANEQAFTVEIVNLQDHSTQVGTRSSKRSEPNAQHAAVNEKPFRFKIDSVILGNNDISYTDSSFPISNKKAIDYHNIAIGGLNLKAGHIKSDGTSYAAVVSELSALERSGFIVKNLGGELAYSDTVISLQKLFLETGSNKLAGNAEIRIIKTPGRKDNYRLNTKLATPGLALSEVLYFQPELAKNKYFAPLLNKSIALNTTIDGLLNDLYIRQLVLRQGATSINASAHVLNLPDVDRMVIDLQLQEFSSTRKDILALLPKGLIADSIVHYIPEKISLKGTYKGTMDNMYADLQLVSSYGNAGIKGKLIHITDPRNAVYDLNAALKQVDLAALLQDTTLGPVTGKIKLKGKGFEPRTMLADYRLRLDNATYSGYTYQNIDVNGNIDHNKINADIHSQDPNAAVNGTFFINLNEGARALKTNVQIANLDLFKLGFLKDTVNYKGNIFADFPLADTSGIQGNMLLTGSMLNYNNRNIVVDTITLTARHSLDSQYLKLLSPYTDIELAGIYKLQELPPAINTVINNYFVVNAKRDTAFHTDVNAVLKANFNIPDSIASLLGNLNSVSPFSVSGSLDTKKNQISFLGGISKLNYSDLEIDSLGFHLNRLETDRENPEELKFEVSINKLLGPSYELKKTVLQGGAYKGIIKGKLEFLDDRLAPRYRLPFAFTNDPERPNVSIPDSLILNGKKWFVSKDNKIYLDTKHLSGSLLTIGNNGTNIDFKTSDHNPEGLPMELKISQFQLKDIAEIFISDTALARGTVNGHLDISSLTPLNFTTDIKIDSLELMKSKLGTLRALVEQAEKGEYTVNTTLKSDHNDVSLTGNYSTNTHNADLDLKLTQLDLANLKPIASSLFSDLGGNVIGNLKITGSLDEPTIIGKINTDSVFAIYGMTGTYIRIPAAQFLFDENGVQFPELVITDSVGHEGKITGRMNSRDYRSFNADLRFVAKDFQIVGRRKMADQGIYGPTNADLNITLRGTEKAMAIEGRVNVKDKSEFTYVFKSDVYDQAGEGLVEFFDPSKPLDTARNVKPGKSSLGFKLTTNLYINLTPTSSVTIIMDEISGDHLKAKGNADLNFIMSPDGTKDLLGTYKIEAGEYDLSIAGLIRRKFAIQNGSTINWSGDPLKGIMDITAKYETRISAGELVNDIEQVPGINRQKLNFDVYIMLKNELLKPDISFKLDMKAEDQQAFNGLIYTRIKQVNTIPAELNKQVMGILAFNQFIAENPFSSFTSSGGDFSTQAFNTAGKLLTQELTDLVGKYVKDVNIDFGLEQQKDYTTGQAVQRTDLQVGVSKSFADNRLNVYVGSNFALEGANQDNAALAGLAGDVTIEYMLTKDGKYRLKGYRLTDNDLIFQGNVVRTGVSFVVVLEFNKFRNMFSNKKKKN